MKWKRENGGKKLKVILLFKLHCNELKTVNIMKQNKIESAKMAKKSKLKKEYDYRESKD